MRPVAANGEIFDLVEIGQGPVVIFLHGALGDHRTFLPHCRALSRRCRAITYDQRYFGTRDWRPDGPAFGIDAHVNDLIALVESLDCGPVRVVAWSYAGHEALAAAKARPDLFSAMLVYESGFQTFMTDKTDIAAFRQAMAEMFAPIAAAAGRGDLLAAARALIDGSACQDGFFDAQSERSRRIQNDNLATMPLLLAQTPPPKISADDLASLDVPVTFVAGQSTHNVYRLVADAAIAALGGDRHRIIEGQGHFWPDADPEGFCALVDDWLAA